MKNIGQIKLAIAIGFAIALSACAKPDDKSKLAENARIQGKEQAEAEFEQQMKEKDALVQRARDEGRAQAEEELKTQLENKDKLVEKARAEGRAVAEEEFKVQLENQEKLLAKSRAEGRAVAEEEYKVQLENQEQLLAKSRAEGRAVAEEEFKVQLENQEKIVAQARAEGRAQAEEQLKLENGNLTAKATKMEEDLAKRHLFYQATAGTYEGAIETEEGNFNVRVTLVPSLTPFPVNRVRQLDEIAADINNLYLNAQIVQWSPDNTMTSVGCRVSNVRPDLVNGTISIASSECSNLYILNISNVKATATRRATASKTVASDIYKKKVKTVSALVGEVRPTTNAAIYDLFANRKGK